MEAVAEAANVWANQARQARAAMVAELVDYRRLERLVQTVVAVAAVGQETDHAEFLCLAVRIQITTLAVLAAQE